MAPTKAPAYQESDDHVPNPTDQYGTLDTSGTAGAAHAKLEEITPVFEVASAQEAQVAAKAIDPKDESVHPSMVTMPDDKGRSRDEATKAVKDRAKATQDKADAGLAGTRTTPAQAEAAKSTKSDKDSDK